MASKKTLTEGEATGRQHKTTLEEQTERVFRKVLTFWTRLPLLQHYYHLIISST